MAEKKHLKRLRGTIFTRCELPNELFNSNRLVKTKIKQMLGRVGFLMLRDGSLEIKGANCPDLTSQDVKSRGSSMS